MNTLSQQEINVSQPTLWNTNFIVVSLINFLVLFTYYLLLVTIGNYVVDTFATSKSMAGLVTGIMVIGCLVGRFLTGYFIQIVGCKKALFTGVIAFIVTMSLYLLAYNLPILLFIRFISGIAIGIIGTVTGTIVVYIVPANRRGEGISYFSLSTIMATALGPFSGILLVQYLPFTALFYFAVAIGVICFFITIKLNAYQLTVKKTKIEQHTRATWLQLSNYIEPAALRISFVVMLVATGYAAIQAYLSFYAKTLNLLDTASFFFVIYAVFILLSRPFTGRLFDLKGENIIVYPALILLIVGFILLSFTDQAWQLLLAGALIGLGFGNFQSTAQAIAVKVSPSSKVAQATSTYFILFDLGIGLGPYFMGFIIPYMDYRGLYLICALITLLAMLLYFVIHKTPKQPPIINDDVR